MIATADDNGLLKVFRNPVRKDCKAREYRGHSEHVTNVAFIG